jgi:hypothetical protein
MKITFKQNYVEQLSLDQLSTAQFLFLADAASEQLGWIFGNITATCLTAYTNNGLFAHNSEIKMKVANGIAFIQSRSMGDGITGVTADKKNVEDFIATFKKLRKTLPAEEYTIVYEDAADIFSHNEEEAEVLQENSSIPDINIGIKQTA